MHGHVYSFILNSHKSGRGALVGREVRLVRAGGYRGLCLVKAAHRSFLCRWCN